MIPDLVVDAIATHRLTRLATADVITEPIRESIVRYAYRTKLVPDEGWIDDCLAGGGDVITAVGDDDEAPMLATLVTCRWCAGIWISGFVVAARRYAPFAWDPLARLLVLSDAAAFLARLEDG